MQIALLNQTATVILPKEGRKRVGLYGENGEKGFDRPRGMGL